MDDQTYTNRHPEAPRSSLRERVTGNRFLRGVGNAGGAVNGLLGQGSVALPPLPPAVECLAPPVPENDEFAAAFRKVQKAHTRER